MQRPALQPLDLALAGAAAAVTVGLLEAALLLWGFGEPALDAAVLRFAGISYAAAGAALSLLLYLPARWLGRLAGSDLFPWRLRAASGRGLARAWIATQLLLWAALVLATDVTTLLLRARLGSPEGALAFCGSGILALLCGWWWLPRAAWAPGVGPARRGPVLWLLALISASCAAPWALQRFVYATSELPARTAAREEALGPPPLPRSAAPGPPTARFPDIVLITLDTTRADHLSAYGYGRDTTPRLEEFAREALRFDSAWSSSSWTVPAHATLFTGLFTYSHGARRMTAAEVAAERDRTGSRFRARIRPLDPAHLTLAEILRAQGYRTGAVVAGPYLYSVLGMAQGFEWYDDRIWVSIAPSLALYRLLNYRLVTFEPDRCRFAHGFRWGDEVTASATDWLARVGPERFFLFVNYFDAHAPYTPPREHRHRYPGSAALPRPREQEAAFQAIIQGERHLTEEELGWLSSQYDAELRYQDEQMGRLFDRLKEMGRWDEALVVVTADHGEHLGEKDQLGHGFTLYAPVTRVPLLVKFPRSDGVAAGVRTHPVHLADILPTVLLRLGLPAPPGGVALQGRPLLDESEHVVLSELYCDLLRVERFGEQYRHLIRAWTGAGARAHEVQPLDAAGDPSGPPAVEAFDLRADPLELQALSGEAPGAELLSRLHLWIQGAPAYVPSPWMRPLDSAAAAPALAEVGYAGVEPPAPRPREDRP